MRAMGLRLEISRFAAQYGRGFDAEVPLADDLIDREAQEAARRDFVNAQMPTARYALVRQITESDGRSERSAIYTFPTLVEATYFRLGASHL